MTHDCKGSVYVKGCIQCAARLVMSARPSRAQQEAMLGYLERYGQINRKDVIEELKRNDL